MLIKPLRSFRKFLATFAVNGFQLFGQHQKKQEQWAKKGMLKMM